MTNEMYLSRLEVPGMDSGIWFYDINRLAKEAGVDGATLPRTVRILLESLIRMQGHPAYTAEHMHALAAWSPEAAEAELPFMPARVLLQDFTGVPCVVDLAALRSAMQRAGLDPARIEPLVPVDLVVDHSVQLDSAGCADALAVNTAREFERNAERYRFLKWGQGAFEKLRVLPPGLGICHQINMEYLASCVAVQEVTNGQGGSRRIAFPDTLVGTDSHTTTVNCMGVLGWGVGGIEAEAAMLGQPIPILTPQVVGFRLSGALRSGVTATDLALTATRMLRELGVVGKFVEFIGEGASRLSLADRCPVANMAPEYGATTGFFAVDEKTIDYLRETGRSEEQCAWIEAYCRAQGLWGCETDAVYNQTLELDLSTVEPSLAGPSRPHQQLSLPGLKRNFAELAAERGGRVPDESVDCKNELGDGSVVIASITSCTNTSNPGLMTGAALLARNAVAKGLSVPGHVKTSFAPGSHAAALYLEKAGLMEPLNRLGFQIAAYGCATCIGNSGPLDPETERVIREKELTVAAVLSGNRNFEGRVHPQTKINYLASPPLVVAYALAGTVNIDLETEPLGRTPEGDAVYLKDIWPSSDALQAAVAQAADPAFYTGVYADLAAFSPEWNALEAEGGMVFAWNENSTYIREPSFFDGCGQAPEALSDLCAARVLGFFGDFITTDHISPAGSIAGHSPAAAWLRENGTLDRDFNSYGSRRGNHEVMMRGTFANIRIRNRLVEGEGGRTRYFVDDGREEEMSIYDAAVRYAGAGVPLVVVAGKMYGAGSSRDWAAKGTRLLGVRAVLAESFERIHRSNLVGMGILPCEFVDGQTAERLGLTGRETISITGIAEGLTPGKRLLVTAVDAQAGSGGAVKTFEVKARVDTPLEIDYLKNGGVLNYVLRGMMDESSN